MSKTKDELQSKVNSYVSRQPGGKTANQQTFGIYARQEEFEGRNT